MIERTFPSSKKQNVHVISDSLHDCVTSCNQLRERSRIGSDDDQNYHRPKEDYVKTKFKVGRFASAKMKYPSSIRSKVQPLSLEESIKLMDSHNRTKRHSELYSSPRKYLHVQKQKNLSKKWSKDALRARIQKPSQQREEAHTNANALRARTHKPTNQHALMPIMPQSQILDVLTPREKVQKVLHLFKMILEELEQQKAAHGGTNKTSLDAHAIILRDGKQVNGEKLVGVVPGVEIGDEFQYKAELKIIGLHFYLSGGIDYMTKEGMVLATSLVASEGNGYDDIFESDVVIYCGEGMCMKSENSKVIEDQKMTKGNLSLANSMKAKSPVRVISGRKRMGGKGKQYVYEGLYSVEQYWEEQGPLGNFIFKFKLQKLPGQASTH